MSSIVTVNLENLSESAREEVLRSLEQPDTARPTNPLHGVKDGETFTIAGIELIKFPAVNGKVPVMTRDCLFASQFGDHTNDLSKSPILKKMVEEVLPKVIEAVGEENVCTFDTDLTTLDGLKPYGVLKSQVSLPTLDFYRANVEIFDKYKVDRWFWLATPESAKPHDDPYWTLCVSPSGGLDYYNYGNDYGVRPFFYFESSIFGSFEE